MTDSELSEATENVKALKSAVRDLTRQTKTTKRVAWTASVALALSIGAGLKGYLVAADARNEMACGVRHGLADFTDALVAASPNATQEKVDAFTADYTSDLPPCNEEET